MGDENERLEPQLLDHSIEIAALVLCGLRVTRWLVGGPPAKEVKGDHLTLRHEIGKESVAEMHVVGEAV